MSKRYYFFYLEIALKKEDDLNIYAYENVSHIPTRKLIEIFNIKIEKDPQLLEGYFLTKAMCRKHKSYLNKHTCALNLDVFEYCLRQYAANDYDGVRKLYKQDLME